VPPFSSKYIDIDGVVLHYLHTGPTTLPDVLPVLDRGTPILLVHGGGRNAGDWKRQLAGLGDRHSVVALDLPAHGRSTGIEALPTIEDYARVVEAFARVLLRRKAILVGWSMGFSIALSLAARHPDRWAGLVLMAGLPYWRPEPGFLEPLHDVVRGRLPQQFNTLMFSPATSMDVMREVWMEQVKTDPRVLYGDFLAGGLFDGRPLLPRVRTPTLVIHGADDKLVSLEQAQATAGAIAGARLEVIPAAGHVPQVEQAERFNEILGGFADRVGQGPG
jgi:pyruvate dehydrogenase E2 component (dihydrolipoamide acetyltransferase)